MHLNFNDMEHLPKEYMRPNFNVIDMVKRTGENPTWLHMGVGNIFRIMIGGLQQDLLEAGHTDTGIIAYEAFDNEIIPLTWGKSHSFTLGVTLHASGKVEKRIITSFAEFVNQNLARLTEIVSAPTLQLISFTITENGYKVDPAKICTSPATAETTLEQVAAGLLARQKTNGAPIALVSLDNFAENGTMVQKAMTAIAKAWNKNGEAPLEFIDYVNSMAYPWTMIDKITPRPSEDVAAMLAADGLTDMTIHQTAKNTFVAPFVNAEAPQYLILEDNFPNGRPPFEKLQKSGVYMTDRDTVRKMDQMKVCACLNPLHTILGVAGPLLGHPTIAACMKDKRLVRLLQKAAEEALPTVASPGIIDPMAFLHEVLTERFPNPYIPDTPERIACDTSQKIPVRFGVAMKARVAQNIPTDNLEAVPMFVALWLRYRMGINDKCEAMPPSPDPLMPEAVKVLDGLQFGEKVDLRPILSDAEIFGVDLYTVGLGEKVKKLFAELSAAPGAVGKRLE